MKCTLFSIFILLSALSLAQDSLEVTSHVVREEFYQDSKGYLKIRILYSDTIISDIVHYLRTNTLYYNEPGEISFVRISMIDGELWGKSFVYHKTGEFHVSVEYLNGFRHGLWTTQFPEKIDYQGHYKHGKLDGKWIYQNFDGELVESTYKDGILIEGKDISGNIYGIFELSHIESEN
ncbi:MAG: hypothetical protein HRT58_22610 [Crocinitomicaceae bacterium]|nr:hypothetical protein [Flavobacteriales bacterium]NQZ38471.1 hypothetical protein [Crocinitomicaceae bacterium]